MTMKVNVAVRWLTALASLLVLCEVALAEPYLAVLKGMQCSNCHAHPAGGGKRNIYGNVFAQTELPERRLGDPSAKLWTGEVFNKWLSVGADFRGGYDSVDIPGRSSVSDSGINQGTIYLEANIVPERLSVYYDRKIAPDRDIDRELYLKFKSPDNRFHVTAGQFFIPYGLRLQDDSAFIRQATGINFNFADRGIQFGYESGPWSAHVSVTNGNGLGPVFESTDQVSFVANYVRPRWRAGVSVNSTDSAAGDRQMQNAFFGLKTGPLVWLGEFDFISDDLPGGSSRDAVAGLIEGNWGFRKGHNAKVSYEYLDPDDSISEDHQVRWSFLWEYTPVQFIQGRLGLRLYDGIPQVDFQNRDEFFAEIHVFF